MHENPSSRPSEIRHTSSTRYVRNRDVREPPVARPGSMPGMPKAIFTEDDPTTVAELARIDPQSRQIRQRASASGSVN